MERAQARDRVRPASIGDVAAKAGVSSQTVSRVSNGLDTVRPETRDRVLAAMAALDYRPNSAARALKSGRFQTIGVLMFTLQNIGSIRVLDAITAEAAAHGFSIDLISIGDTSTGGITDALSRLDRESVDGIIVILEAHELQEHSITFPDRIPSVLVDSREYHDRVSVNADQRQGARLAVEHLLELGHETVWHVAGPTESSNAAADRHDSWRETLIAHDREVPEPLGGSWLAESGYEAGRIIARRDDVTAVFCANDQLALGVLRALHEAGRGVPSELSVVGFDDNPESAEYWPPLTTVRQNFAEVGQRAFELLNQAIQHEDVASGLRLIDNELVVRASSGRYPAPQ
jgi:DNA-binding LacI/PurR family transcriptional regulator